MPYQDKGHSTTPTPTSSTDYAAQANPAVFTAELNREDYNGIRDTILHRGEIIAGAYRPIPLGKVRRNGSVEQVASTLGQCPIYENDNFLITLPRPGGFLGRGVVCCVAVERE